MDARPVQAILELAWLDREALVRELVDMHLHILETGEVLYNPHGVPGFEILQICHCHHLLPFTHQSLRHPVRVTSSFLFPSFLPDFDRTVTNTLPTLLLSPQPWSSNSALMALRSQS